MPGYANPQNLNRFAYVLNNPLRYTDPTGHMVASDLAGTGEGGSCDKKCLEKLKEERKQKKKKKKEVVTIGHLPVPDPGIIAPLINPQSSSGTPPFFTQAGFSGSTYSNVTIPPLPPSPFACGWVDCALSAGSLIFSGLTMSVVPEISVPAFVADVVVTFVAITHTYDDYQQGEISGTTGLALGITGFVGLYPGPIGFGFSALNTIVTVFGFPYPY